MSRAPRTVQDIHRETLKRIAAAKTGDDVNKALNDGIQLALQGTVDVQSQYIKATGPLVTRGAALHGQRKGKVDLLTEAIGRALATLGQEATAEAVLCHIERSGSVVDRIEPDGSIVWKDAKGREKRLSRRTFDNKVSGRRN